ncbi:hypothetical protein PPACK8108_LOCUS94, partial [Phakopsora pachyrhizi]
MPEEIDENDEDKDEDEDENGNDDNDRMAEGEIILGLPACMMDSADSINDFNLYSSASTSRSNKNPIGKDPMPMEPLEKDLDLLFHICTNLLRCRMCGRHDFLAAIRELLLLTQKHSVAEAFLSSGVPAILLQSFSFKTESRGYLPYAAMLLRHTAESSAVKNSIMGKEIVHFFTSHSRHRQADLPSFCRNIAPMAWGDWNTLMDCISVVCKLIPNAVTGPGKYERGSFKQHFRGQRPAREELSVPVPSSISTDLLDALPPEIQAEVIRSEVAAEERRRREEDLERRNTTSGSANRALSASADLDPATFLASLDPTLREAVLLDQDEGFISTLPRNILAERDPLGGLATTSGASQIGTSSKKTLVKADTVQFLDRSGIAALVRLMFFPQPLCRHSLQKVLVNLCENSRSFSSRAIKALVSPTSKSTGKLQREAHIGPLPQFPGESVPNLIALRCLEALSPLVTANDRVPIYFLTKQEVPVVLHKQSAKKGKGKEKSSTSVTYPLVGLFAPLDRDSLLKQPNLTESITSLLALISRPLTALAEKLEDTKPQASGTSSLGALFLPVPEESTNLGSSSLSLNPSGGPMTSGDAPQGTISKKTETPSNVLEKAPFLAPNDLRMIVNVLDSGKCSSKTFSHTVTFMQALSTAPHGREVIAAELLERAQFLGEALLPDLDELAGAIKEASNAAEVRSLTLAKFLSASAQQAKLLRIMKTTEFLDAHPLTMTSNDLFSPSGPNTALVDPSAPKIRFRPLWEKLSHCLTLIQERNYMIHIATVLLPLMESFLVVCKRVGISTAKSHRGTQSPRLEDASLDVMTRFFLSFTRSHRKVLNTMVRNNPGLMSGSFSILVHNPKHGNVQLKVRRPHVFEDSFHSLARRTGDELKYGKLSVRFYDEEGVDAGGVTREWLTILIKQMLDPSYALFTGSDTHSKTYQPNTASSLNPDNHGFFTFCGQVIEKETLPQWFEEARVFYQTTLPSKNSAKIQHAVLALLVPWAKKIS